MTKTKVCRGCGVEFQYDACHDRYRLYCSPQCRAESWTRLHLPSDGQRTLCNERRRACYRANVDAERVRCRQNRLDHIAEERDRDRARYLQNVNGIREKAIERGKKRWRDAHGGPPTERECDQCGKLYTPQKNHPSNRFCSRSCRDKYHDRIKRLMLKSVPKEPYQDGYIFERDGWRCHLCGGRISKTLRAPHPKSASIDHLVPLSCGGHDVPENVKAAHLGCNCAKGASAMNEQLLLVG